MADRTSAKLHKVEIKRRIGRGGMADVYLAEHRSLGHSVALKVLHAHLLQDEDARRRFQAEAKAVAGLRHPNIVEIYDFDLVDGRPFIVMELLDGPSLSDFLGPLHARGGRLQHDIVVRLMADVAKALDYAHSKGIVHRDVKPANIILRSPSGRVEPGSALPADVSAVLTDFGIARVASNTSATVTGTLLGTPAYMAPEQVMGKSVDARTDIYALGVVTYEMLSGRPPFASTAKANSPAAVLFKHVHEEPPAMTVEPPQLQNVVARALAKKPEDRYLTAGDMVRDLKRAAAGGMPEPVTMRGGPVDTLRVLQRSKARKRSRRAWLLGAALGITALLLGGGLLLGWSAFDGDGLLAAGDEVGTSEAVTGAEGEGTEQLPGGEQGNPSQVPGGSGPQPSATPTPDPESSPTPSDAEAAPTSDNSPSDTPTPTEDGGADDPPDGEPEPSDTPSPSATPTATRTPTDTPTPNPSDTPQPSATPTLTPTPTETPLLPTLDLGDL